MKCHNGTISLVNKNGEVLNAHKYHGIKYRQDIIDSWWQIYGEGMNRYYLQICPTPEDEEKPPIQKEQRFRSGELPKTYKLSGLKRYTFYPDR